MILTTKSDAGDSCVMARKLRVEYSGAIYHVMSRGDRREPIFNLVLTPSMLETSTGSRIPEKFGENFRRQIP